MSGVHKWKDIKRKSQYQPDALDEMIDEATAADPTFPALLDAAVKRRPPSRQDYGTPWEFIYAVERRFGPIDFDLAASAENCKTRELSGFKNYLDVSEDALSCDWSHYLRVGRLAWLNPPFAHIGPWAKKCAELDGTGARIAMLTPASVGSNWFRNHVHGKALVLALSPRITFEGCPAPFNKDCMLSVYGEPPGFDVWRWK